jgi:hypothetical protein
MGDGTSGLFAALAKTRAEIAAAAHDSKNQHQRYDYTSSEAVIDRCSKTLAANGVSLVPVSSRLGEQDSIGSCILDSSWMLVHSSGETHEIRRDMPVCPGKGRPLDKAMCAALTVNLAYLLRDICGLKRPDASDDINGRDDSAYEHEPRSKEPSPESLENEIQSLLTQLKACESEPEYQALRNKGRYLYRKSNDEQRDAIMDAIEAADERLGKQGK